MFFGAKREIFEAATNLRRTMTLPELILWKRLRNRSVFKFKFRRQHPIDKFIVDFYCHELKLVIEIDGEIHENDIYKAYDLIRTDELNKYGLKIIRFSNNQILFEIDSVITILLDRIRELSPL